MLCFATRLDLLDIQALKGLGDHDLEPPPKTSQCVTVGLRFAVEMSITVCERSHNFASCGAFRDRQERREDEMLSRSITAAGSSAARVQGPTAAYSRRAIRAAIRYWWCQSKYAAIVTLGSQLTPALLDEEPLVRVYLDAAKARTVAQELP